MQNGRVPLSGLCRSFIFVYACGAVLPDIKASAPQVLYGPVLATFSASALEAFYSNPIVADSWDGH